MTGRQTKEVGRKENIWCLLSSKPLDCLLRVRDRSDLRSEGCHDSGLLWGLYKTFCPFPSTLSLPTLVLSTTSLYIRTRLNVRDNTTKSISVCPSKSL